MEIMQINTEPTYTFTLTRKEAEVLAQMLQNPVSREESLQERKLRESIFYSVFPDARDASHQ